VSINIQLEPLLALVAGLAAIVLPARLATRVVGAYLVIWSAMELAGYF
jgi:hypothetical protein